MSNYSIQRRNLIKGATASLALAALHASGMPLLFEPEKTYRVGLIGTGWYGKSDLFRLIQVANVEVVALCDVDKNLLTEAGTMVSQRQKSKKVPLLYNDHQKMLAENKLDLVRHWHSRSLACLANHRCHKSRSTCISSKTYQRRCDGRRSPGSCCTKIQ